MTPAEQAREIIDEEAREECPRFREVLYAHLRKGWYCWSSPTAFCLARPVQSSWPPEMLWDLKHSTLPNPADCWHIWIAVGDVSELIDRLPYPLPLLSFQHGQGYQVKILEADRALHLIQRYGKRSRIQSSTGPEHATATGA